jgi:metal-responsive CopG/Arc/MetJ family transcriptional regulator
MATHRISVRVSPKLRQRLKHEAAAKRKRPSDVVRDALERYLNERTTPETCYDVAVRTGFLGVAKKAPPDLSTNRKYLKGFGR